MYEYCHGAIVQPYFRHKSKHDCDLYSELETEEHLIGKRKLFEWICKQDGVSDAVLEAYLPETKQRPDIMFNYNGKRCVIEYQCTPITEEYTYRHSLYKFSKIKDIWILGTQKYLNYTSGGVNRRMKEIERKNKIYYDPFNDLFMQRYLTSLKAYPEISLCATVEKAIQCTKSFGYSAFRDKEKILCAPLDSVMYDGAFHPTESGRAKYDRVHRRIVEIVDDAFDRIATSGKRSGIEFEIIKAPIDDISVGQTKGFTGSATIPHGIKRLRMDARLTYTFIDGIPLWSVCIKLGNAKWWKPNVNTKIMLAYLDGNFTSDFKQMLRKG